MPASQEASHATRAVSDHAKDAVPSQIQVVEEKYKEFLAADWELYGTIGIVLLICVISLAVICKHKPRCIGE